MGKGGQLREDRKMQSCDSELLCTVCLYVLEGDNKEGMGKNNSFTLPFRWSINSNLNIHPPSLGVNMLPSFDICFTL